nr:DUF4124 domain-containing protein [Pseudomaricurvus sp. HS19]
MAGVLIAALGGVSPALQAEIYQWRDAQGKLHFSDKKPERESAEEISGQLAPLNLDESAAEQSRLGQVFRGETPEERQWRQRQESEARAAEQEQAQRCDEMRRYLQAISGPVYFEREDGSTYDVSVQEQQRRMRAAAAQIADECDPD